MAKSEIRSTLLICLQTVICSLVYVIFHGYKINCSNKFVNKHRMQVYACYVFALYSVALNVKL